MSEISQDEGFLKAAILDTFVPGGSPNDVEKVLESTLSRKHDGSSSVLQDVEQRSLVFFDEKITIYVVLRVPKISREALSHRLSRLDVGLDVYASNDNGPQSPREGGEANRDLLFSGSVLEKDKPMILGGREDDTTEFAPLLLAVWRAEAVLHRPRLRFPNPAISFVAYAILSATTTLSTLPLGDEYLRPFVPPPINLLAPLGFGDQDNGANLLSPSRVSRILPQPDSENSPLRVRHRPARKTRFIPAANARVRYSRMNAYQRRPATIASLDFEATAFLDFNVELLEVGFELENGRAEDLTSLDLPLLCRPRDSITFIYRLHPENGTESPSPSTTATAGLISIALVARILVSDTCRPTIYLNWTAHVDFSTPLNPTFGGPSQAMQRTNRPVSLPVRNSSTNIPPTSTDDPRTSSSTTSTGSSLVLTFSGPSTVRVGSIFAWEITVVNRSPKTRKLALVAIPQRSKKTDTRRHAPKSSSTNSAQRDWGLTRKPPRDDVAPAVTDENILLAMQRSAGLGGGGAGADLVCVSPDVRVGPLASGCCHVTELRLLALVPGPLRLEVVRLADLDTSETTDIRDLPDVVALEFEGEKEDAEVGR